VTPLIFDTQRHLWLDLGALYPEPETESVPSLPHTCDDCGAHFKSGEGDALREHIPLCRSWMDRIAVKDAAGNTLGMLGDPDPVKLARHVQLYGREGVGPWLEKPDARVVSAVIRRRSGSRRPSRQTRMDKRPKSRKFSENA
jgi:hypothetical protein